MKNNYSPPCAGIIVRNTLVTYDRENEKIGFWKTNCSELWQRLHISGAPAPVSDVPTSKSVSVPPPVVYSNNNTIAGMAPAVAPSGLPQKVLPGRISYENIRSLYASLPNQICSMNFLFSFSFHFLY